MFSMTSFRIMKRMVWRKRLQAYFWHLWNVLRMHNFDCIRVWGREMRERKDKEQMVKWWNGTYIFMFSFLNSDNNFRLISKLEIIYTHSVCHRIWMYKKSFEDVILCLMWCMFFSFVLEYWYDLEKICFTLICVCLL